MKNWLIVLMAVSLLTVSGCGFSHETINESTIIINRDGTIDSVIVEDFPVNKYDENELRQMIHDNVWAYNNTHDSGDVKLISCNVADDMVTVEMMYNSGTDYADFNDRDFYFGTVSAARDAGYAKNATLNNAHGDNTVSGEMINDLATYHMVVFDENVNVMTYGSVLYYSSNLEILADNTVRRTEDAQGLGYIIVK